MKAETLIANLENTHSHTLNVKQFLRVLLWMNEVYVTELEGFKDLTESQKNALLDTSIKTQNIVDFLDDPFDDLQDFVNET